MFDLACVCVLRIMKAFGGSKNWGFLFLAGPQNKVYIIWGAYVGVPTVMRKLSLRKGLLEDAVPGLTHATNQGVPATPMTYSLVVLTL